MNRTLTLAAICGFLTLTPQDTRADVLAHIDLSEQRLHLYVDGEKKDTWKVSTGKKHGWTHTGTFRPQFLSRNHRSSLFRGAPMPYSVFYDSHWAVHGTTAIKRLGNPASHGCVRLHPKNAAVLFNLVARQGKKNSVIWITE
jgi:lipoprotein-anchoring transpeptidase ErfK/SrfK